MDAKLQELIGLEQKRQSENLELIASENYVSPAVSEAVGSCLTNKYAEGYPGKRYYGGCQYVDEIETLAIERAKALFHAEHANVQPHCGSQANMGAYMALLELGDKIMACSLNGGGHLTHSSSVSFVSRLYRVVTYGVDGNGLYDLDAIRELARKERPKLIVAGASAYPRFIDFAAFRGIANEVGAYLMVDMAHIAGLVAAGAHPSPVPYADIVTSTTHKTLRGPRGGLILCKKEHAAKVDSAIFPRIQGGGLQHVVAGKAACFYEASQPEFAEYGKQIVKNAKALAKTLMDSGLELVTGGTDNHLMLVKLLNTDFCGKEAETLLDAAQITVNKNMIPGDPRKPSQASGIRMGTAAVTTRGMKEPEMALIGQWIADLLLKKAAPEAVKAQVLALTAKFPVP